MAKPKQLKLALPTEGYVWIFRPFITLKNGKRLYASYYGKKAFPILVPAK